MILYLLRHAIALDQGEDFTGPDALRPLSREGKKKMRKIARGMYALDLSIELILSSPLTRAHETATIVAEELALEDRLEVSPRLSPGGSPRQLLQEVSARPSSPGRILLVGHEPQLSRLIAYLLSGDDSLPVTMKKGSLCKLTLSTLRYERSATLEWLLAPSQLVRLSQVR